MFIVRLFRPDTRRRDQRAGRQPGRGLLAEDRASASLPAPAKATASVIGRAADGEGQQPSNAASATSALVPPWTYLAAPVRLNLAAGDVGA
jgi:hypothetical protein